MNYSLRKRNMKYKYAFITLNAITRTQYDLQYQTLYATYSLNKLKRKVKPIISKFYDVKNYDNITLGYGLFCVNTGFNEYNESDFTFIIESFCKMSIFCFSI